MKKLKKNSEINANVNELKKLSAFIGIRKSRIYQNLIASMSNINLHLRSDHLKKKKNEEKRSSKIYYFKLLFDNFLHFSL